MGIYCQELTSNVRSRKPRFGEMYWGKKGGCAAAAMVKDPAHQRALKSPGTKIRVRGRSGNVAIKRSVRKKVMISQSNA